MPTPYPSIQRLRIDLPIDLRGWNAFTGLGSGGTRVIREGVPGVADHLLLWSTGTEVHVRPHYTLATWDDLWADATAHIHASGFGGLFPFDLGAQRALREGMLGLLEQAIAAVARRNPVTAALVRQCADTIRTASEAGIGLEAR